MGGTAARDDDDAIMMGGTAARDTTMTMMPS